MSIIVNYLTILKSMSVLKVVYFEFTLFLQNIPILNIINVILLNSLLPLLNIIKFLIQSSVLTHLVLLSCFSNICRPPLVAHYRMLSNISHSASNMLQCTTLPAQLSRALSLSLS